MKRKHLLNRHSPWAGSIEGQKLFLDGESSEKNFRAVPEYDRQNDPWEGSVRLQRSEYDPREGFVRLQRSEYDPREGFVRLQRPAKGRLEHFASIRRIFFRHCQEINIINSI
jgi:hypothetical protein